MPTILPVLVVTPNLCFDRTLRIERFEPGAVARPYDVEVTIGGKGVNVCRAVADLGGHADLLGLVGEADRASFTTLAAPEELRLHAVTVAGAVRQATIIIEDSGRATVLNEPGPLVGEDDAARVLDRAAALMAGRGWSRAVAACRPACPPTSTAASPGSRATAARSRVVDAARTALADALAAEPDVVTPNLHEVEGVLGGRVDEASHDDAPLEEVRDRAFASAEALLDRGARRALVTAGRTARPSSHRANGCGWTRRGSRSRTRSVPGTRWSVGFSWRSMAAPTWPDAVRHAVAVASAAVEHPVAGHLDAARVAVLAGRERVGS